MELLRAVTSRPTLQDRINIQLFTKQVRKYLFLWHRFQKGALNLRDPYYNRMPRLAFEVDLNRNTTHYRLMGY